MIDWRQRWRDLAPREQWLACTVGLAVLGMLYVLLVADPLSQRRDAQAKRLHQAENRQQATSHALDQLDARQAADPNLQYRTALQAAQASRAGIIARIEADTRSLVSPTRMQALLQDLLRAQPRLALLGLESFSAPLQLPAEAAVQRQAGQAKGAQAMPDVFYRHGLRLSLEGGYFELLAYLRSIQASGWRLHWDSLDYQVDAATGRGRISIELHTLSRHAGWVGV